MKYVLALLLVVFSISQASRWDIDEYKDEYKPDWEIKAETNSEVPLFKIKGQGKIGGIGGCGIQATAFYRLAMYLKKDTLKEIVDKWDELALIGILYTIGTYFPIVKEAMVGAEMMANTIASLKNLNCQSAMKMMTSYYKRTSSLVRACVANKLGGNVNPWELDPKKLEKLIKEKGVSEGELSNAYYYCMNNASLTDSFSLSSEAFKKWLDKHNLRKWIACNYVKLFGMKDLGNKYSLSYTFLRGASGATMAKVALLAITPEWIVTESEKGYILTPKKIVMGDGTEVDPYFLYHLLKQIVKDDFKELISYAKKGDEDSFYSKVENMNKKFYIKNKDVLPYFDFMYLGYRAMERYKERGLYDKYRKLKSIMYPYTKKFMKQYYLIKKRRLVKEIRKQFNSFKRRVEAGKVAGKDNFEKFCGKEEGKKK